MQAAELSCQRAVPTAKAAHSCTAGQQAASTLPFRLGKAWGYARQQ